ncbi:hypothetical protein CVT91_06340 [Candidatus Atribacteria bacterium HGW-Atribacteria-1]|nr:MAG: hypothetical protein CVT91_06340 [Candidatus Atribacteria bacterium HGW-Atribacteria-1]
MNNKTSFEEIYESYIDAMEAHQAVEIVLEQIEKFFSPDFCALIWSKNNTFYYESIRSKDSSSVKSVEKQTIDLTNPFFKNMLKEKTPIFLEEIKPSNEFNSFIGSDKIRSFYSFPVEFGRKIVGFIIFAYFKKRRLLGDEIDTLKSINNHFTAVMRRSIRFDRIREDRKKAEQITQRLLETQSDLFSEKQRLGILNQELNEKNKQLQAINEQLQQEITDRKRVGEELRKYRNHLEGLVKERTSKLEEKTRDLESANIKLQELDRLKSMFIASMSHELRTPLNSIIGFTGIILQGISGEITEDQRKELTMVKNSAHHLLTLINDVIDVSKIETGKVELIIEEFNLADLMQEVNDSLKVAVDEKGLELSFQMPKELIIKSDERRTKQVIMNLVSNAVKFTDRGEIAIKAARKDERVEVSVADTGIGIKKENIEKLFKQFSRIYVEGRPVAEGTGLGLYLSRKIANLLGGQLKAESEFGKGSMFTFTFPLKYTEVKI